MLEYLVRTSHKPRPLPPGRWLIKQRWNDLLFAHWPVPASVLATLIPEGLQVDTFQGSAWLGMMPFWMDRIKMRGIPPVPGTSGFPDLSLRTYVREERTGTPGVVCLSLDASNLLAVAVGRAAYRLPYHWAEMRMEQRTEREYSFYSRRRFAGRPDLQGALPRAGSVAAAGGERRGLSGTLPDGALQPLFQQPRRPAHSRQSAPHHLAARRGRGGDRAKRSGCGARHSIAGAGAGTALHAEAGGLYLANGAGASVAGGAPRDGGGYTVGVENSEQGTVDRFRRYGLGGLPVLNGE